MKKTIKVILIGALVLFSSACGHDETSETVSMQTMALTSTTLGTTTSTQATTTLRQTTSTTTQVTSTTAITSEIEVKEEPEIVTESVEEETYLPITESERIWLCNLVGSEYGSDYVPITEKAKVVAVVMNRVHSSSYPNTVYDVLVQRDQFSGYQIYNSYTYKVTDSVIQSVDYYFNHVSEFSSTILYFEGDGKWNYFR